MYYRNQEKTVKGRGSEKCSLFRYTSAPQTGSSDDPARRQYDEFRRKILDALSRARPVLNRIKTKLGIGDCEIPVKNPEGGRFTLSLIGGFQSGKSTLFSYLCGGWELSKIGMGAHTTCCRVTATALPRGAPDYAEVTWMDADEISAAISSYTCEKADEIRLHDRAWRRGFESSLLISVTSDRGCDSNEICSAILLLHFFEQYREKLKHGKIRLNDVEEAVAYTCYPDKWNQWNDIKTVNEIDQRFRPEDAAFIFCKSVDYYIDSPELRALGCTIQDCPGLFATKRDSELTRGIIKESDAIFFTTPGEKDLNAEEKKCIAECRANGAASKLVFGANLHGPLWRWEKIIKDEVISYLKRQGFIKPEILHYHAPLALCCSELFQLLHGELHRVSEKAIQEQMDEKGLVLCTPQLYLKDQIEYRISQLDGGTKNIRPEKYISDAEIKWELLDELHCGTKLINRLKAEKFRIILLNKIITPVKDVLGRLDEHLRRAISECNNVLCGQEERMKELLRVRKRIDRDIDTELQKLLSKFDDAIDAELCSAEKDIIEDIKRSKYELTVGADRLNKRHLFTEHLTDKLNRMLINIRNNPFPEAFASVIQNTTAVLDKWVEQLCEFSNKPRTRIEIIRTLAIFRHDEPAINRISLPTKEIDSILDQYGKATWTWRELPGLGFLSDKGEARRIWDELKPLAAAAMRDSVHEMLLSGKHSPRKKIENIANKLMLRNIKPQELAALRKTVGEGRTDIKENEVLRDQLNSIRSGLDKIEEQVKFFL